MVDLSQYLPILIFLGIALGISALFVFLPELSPATLLSLYDDRGVLPDGTVAWIDGGPPDDVDPATLRDRRGSIRQLGLAAVAPCRREHGRDPVVLPVLKQAPG